MVRLQVAQPNGTLPGMNRLRLAGLLLLAAFLVWFAWRIFAPVTPAPPPPPEVVREAFHSTRPLQVEVRQFDAETDLTAGPPWLQRELRHLLARGKMKVAPAPAIAASASAAPFSLRVTLHPDGTQASAELVAPDGIVDKRAELELSNESSLATMLQLAERLPGFLNAPTSGIDWSVALGTSDVQAYEAFLQASDALHDPAATGFTAPPAATRSAIQIEQLEALLRAHPDFARARALLSLAYLSVGGQDEPALTKLAAAAAERALTSDAELADAQAALGIVRLRRTSWTAAREHFDIALALDPSSLAALEGLGCLLMDTGHAHQALTTATRAIELQPGNRGARQCAAYATFATDSQTEGTDEVTADTARIHAAMQLLAGEPAAAEELLRKSDGAREELIRALVAASDGNAATALRVVTRSADERRIDVDAEILFGAALRRPDFVFNRMLRLANQNEAVPLRVLWLPQTQFLREHARFREIISAVNLMPYWQDHGSPDICTAEPTVYGCAFTSP